jgi:hypothetical protein
MMEMTMTQFRNTIAAAAIVAGTFAANTASAYERWVDVVNSGNAAIYSIFITNVDDGSYGRDLLGNQMIPAGYEMRVEPDVTNGYCRFDVKITYETGAEVTLWGVNLCEAMTIKTDGRHWDVDYI